LVVGEFFDRHVIPFGRRHRLADASRLHLDARVAELRQVVAGS
jgi:hypothetical protein